MLYSYLNLYLREGNLFMSNFYEEKEKFLIQLRLFRAELSLTQVEMAHRLNLSPRSYQRLESGQSDPDLMSLVNLSKLKNVNLCDLFEYNDGNCKSISELEVRKHFGSDEFFKTIEVVKDKISKKEQSSLEIMDYLSTENNFMNSELNFIASNFYKTVKNNTLSKVLGVCAGKVKNAGSSMKELDRLVSLFNLNYGKKDQYTSLNLVYEIQGAEKLLTAYCYTTSLNSSDHFSLIWVHSIKDN